MAWPLGPHCQNACDELCDMGHTRLVTLTLALTPVMGFVIWVILGLIGHLMTRAPNPKPNPNPNSNPNPNCMILGLIGYLTTTQIAMRDYLNSMEVT